VIDPRERAVFSRVRREVKASTELTDMYRKRADDLLNSVFQEQRDLILDPCRFKTALCTRRAGKSTAAIRYMLIVALTKRDANVQYIALTGKKARKEIWPDLKRTCRAFDLSAEFNEQSLTVRFKNGSVIVLDGCDTVADVEKFRGSDGGYDLVVIDESKSYSPEMFGELVYEAVGPALGDRMGTMLIIGTPGRFLSGPFYDITNKNAVQRHKRTDGTWSAKSRPYAQRDASEWTGVEYEWSFHRWYTKDNTAKPHIWLEQLATKKRAGWADDEPIWRREYQGEWVADDKGYVYAYLAERNDWEPLSPEDGGNEFGLPADHEWIYVEGSDLGFDDEFAIVVNAWSPTTNTFYMAVHEYTMPGMDIPAIAKAFDDSEAKFREFHARVGDRGGLGKTIFATLVNQYDIEIEPADKHEKRDYQELLNSELRAGRARVRKGSKLGRQMSMLQWKPDGKTEDKDSSPKDATDAGLYSWRYIYSSYSKPKPPPASDVEQIVAKAYSHKAELERKMRAKNSMSEQESRMHDRFGSDDEWTTEDADDWTR
jgi:hypothetical protein